VDATRNATERYPNTTVRSAGYLQVTETPSKPVTGIPAAGCNEIRKVSLVNTEKKNSELTTSFRKKSH